MKLHLPIGLRKALLAVFAVVTPATVAVSAASSSAMAEDTGFQLSQSVIDSLIEQYNNTHDVKIYGANCGAIVGSTITVDNQSVSEEIKFTDLTQTATLLDIEAKIGIAKGLSYIDKTYGGSMTIGEEKNATFNGSLQSASYADGSTATEYIPTAQSSIQYVDLSGAFGENYEGLSGSSAVLVASGKKDITCLHTYNGKITGQVDVQYQYYGKGCLKDHTHKIYNCSVDTVTSNGLQTLANQEFTLNNQTLTQTVTHKAVESFTINYGAVAYELAGGASLTHNGDITMKSGETAHSFTIGSAEGENTAATLKANEGDIILSAYDSFKVQGGSGLQAVNVNINAGGEISFVAGSGVSASESVKLNGGSLRLDGAQISTSAGLVNAPNIEEGEGIVAVDESATADIVLSGKESVTITGKTQLAGNYVSVKDTGSLEISGNSTLLGNKVDVNTTGDITVSEANIGTEGKSEVSLVSTGGNVNILGEPENFGTRLDAETKLAGQSITVSGKDVTWAGGAILYDNAFSMTAAETLELKGGAYLRHNKSQGTAHFQGGDIIVSGVYLDSQNAVTDYVATTGDIEINGSTIYVNKANTLSAKKDIALTGAYVTSNFDVLTLTAGGAISVSNGSQLIGSAVSISGDTFSLNRAIVNADGKGTGVIGDLTLTFAKGIEITNGAKVSAANDILLKGQESNTINGATVNAGGAVKLDSEKMLGSLYAGTSTNTISGSTVNAGTDIVLKTTTGSNTISGSTVTAGNDISLSASLSANKISGGTVTAGQNISLSSNVSNTISGGAVTAGAAENVVGNITLSSAFNTINENAVVKADGNLGMTDGLVGAGVNILNASTVEVGGGVTLDTTANIMGDGASIAAGNGVTLEATANIVDNGNITAGNGAMITGAINYMGGTNVIASNGDLNIEAEPVDSKAIDALLKLLGDKVQIPEAVKPYLDALSIGGNVISKGALTAENGAVNIDGTLNMLMGTTATAKTNATLTGAVNALTGEGGITADGNIDLTANESIGSALSETILKLLQNNTDIEIPEALTTLVQSIAGSTGGVNVLGGADLTSGGYTKMDASVNLMTSGSVNATGALTLDGAINAVTGGSLTGNSVAMQASKGKSLNIGGIISSLLKQDQEGESGEGTEGDSALGSGDSTISDLLAKLDTELLEGNANLLIGSVDENGVYSTNVTATGGDVTLDGKLNVLVGSSVNAQAGSVNLDGTANVLVNGSIAAGNTVTLDGAINAVSGNITGSSVEFVAGENKNLNLGGLISSMLGSKDTEGELNPDGELGDQLPDGVQPDEEKDNGLADLLESLDKMPTLAGNVNLMMGGTVEATTGNVLMDGTANILTGGTVKANDTVALNGTINAVIDGTVSGGNVEFKATENSALNLGGILSGLIGSNETEEGAGESSDNMFSDLIENLGDTLNGNINLVTGGDVDATTGNVSMDGTLNVLTGGTVSAANGAVTLNGTANVLAGGTVDNSQNVELKGAVNAVTGGLVEGDSVTFGAAENGLAVGSMLGSLLESAQIEGLEGVSDMLAGLNLNGNANLVTGGTVNATEEDVTLNGTINLTTGGMVSTTKGDVLVNGSLNIVTGGSMDAADQLTLNGPANIVTGGTLSGGSVELKGDDMPLGSLVGGLLDGVLEGVELPEELNGLVSGSVTDVLNNLTGNFNVVTGGNTMIDADTTTTLTGTVNYVGDGAKVAGTDVTLKAAANVVLNGATLEADDALTLTGTGAGLSLGSFITIPEEYKEYADQLGLTALLNKEASANVVMGNETSLVGKTVELSAMVNMLSEQASVTGDEVALNGNLNIVTDGVNIETTSEDISLVGDLNLVTHIVLDDLMNAIQNGTALPTDNGEYTTMLESAGDINLIGAANAVHGDVVLNAKGDVLMEGSGQPLFNTDSLSLQQVVDLAAKLGAGELLGTAKDEALNLIKDYINSNDLSGLKEMAQQLGAEDLINGTLADAKGSLLDFIAQHADAKLPQLDLTGNVNVVSTGAYVHGTNVTMNGTANLVTDGAKIEADDTVSMNGMANIVAGGSTVSGSDVSMSGGANVIVATTLDNVKDAIESGSLGSITTGGIYQTSVKATDALELDAAANLVHGNVSLSSENSVTMNGVTNVVSGGATVQGANSVEIEGVVNMLTGGVTVGSSDGDITMGGGMNMIVDTTLSNVVDALQQQSFAPLMQGGSADTTLTAASDITLNATVNAVNGGQVTLDAGDTMKMSGAVNVVSGNATLKGEDIVMAGDKSLAVDLNKLLPAEWADKAAELGLSDMLEGGLSLNAVAGGANLIAEDDITMSGIASVVVDTSMGNIMDALATQSIDPLLKGGSSETNLEANNINMLSKLNVVSGGKVRLDADNNVKMDGVANMVHGNTVVEAGNTISVSGAANVVAGGATLDAKNIKMTGTGSLSADLEGLLPADWAEKAAELGLTDVLEKGVNVNAVAGGANLLAEEDITMGGMASFVVDTTVENVVDALKQMSIDPLLQGGTTETVLSAEREIHMNSLVNVVSGGKVTVEAGRNVNMSGVANVVNGNAVVDAGETIYMFGAANVVSGGADLTADYIEMTGNGSINGKIAGVLESVLPGVELPTNGSVNAILGEGTTLDADKVALSGALNVVDGATVSGDDSVLMNGNVNMLSNNAQVVSENGNISINGGAGMQSVTTMENASLTAEKGKVVFNNALVGSTDSTVTAGLGMTVKGNSSVQLNDVLLGGETLVSADSDLEIDGMLQTNDGTFIENMGSLSLHDVALSAGTELFNGGVIQIDGDLSLDSAKLTFVIESLTNNDTAITLGANANITAADITNVTFVIESDKVASALYNYEEFSFVLFENASAEDFSLVKAALAQDEITFTINGATWSNFNDELEVRHEGGNIVIMGNVVIPEPTTATLSLLALAALAARRRRK